MPRELFEFDPPDRFVAGTVGQPGERTFFLQARAGSRLTSVVLEKQQVSVLAERLDQLLDEVLRRAASPLPIPDAASGALDLEPLDVPITEEFRVGSMGLGWNGEIERVVIEVHAVSESDEFEVPGLDEDDVPDDAPPCLRVRITGAQARDFAARAGALVAAGRPPCPFCHLALDPDGHICPRSNGFRRRG
jgi:hypothetical protein